MKSNLQAAKISVGKEQFILFEWPHNKTFPKDLTNAERKVAELINRGFSIPEIARLRGTKKRTIGNQVYMIYQKCELQSVRAKNFSSLRRRLEFIIK